VLIAQAVFLLDHGHSQTDEQTEKLSDVTVSFTADITIAAVVIRRNYTPNGAFASFISFHPSLSNLTSVVAATANWVTS